MSVVIDEMIAEPAAAAPTRGASEGSGGGAESAEPDLDKLDYEFRRARQRSARLFAD